MADLEIYLIGAPRSGKSAVFDALTLTPEGPHFTTRSGHRYGAVKVPDARLAALRDLYQPRKYTPAEVTFVDLAPQGGKTAGAGSDAPSGLANADAFAVVVNAFDERADPAASAEAACLELVLADLDKIERRLERIAQDQRRGQKAAPAEVALLERLRDALRQDIALRDVPLRPDEEKLLRPYQFLSFKPMFFVANLAENALAEGPSPALRAMAAARRIEVLPFCAPLEAEIARLDPATQRDFLRDYGLEEPGRVRLLQYAFRSLRLISFFTVGEDEVRAWPVRQGTTAWEAAGKIHSDIQRGFIRAETIASEALLQAGSWAQCRENGALRLEGKEYLVQDGDVIHFRFNA